MVSAEQTDICSEELAGLARARRDYDVRRLPLMNAAAEKLSNIGLFEDVSSFALAVFGTDAADQPRAVPDSSLTRILKRFPVSRAGMLFARAPEGSRGTVRANSIPVPRQRVLPGRAYMYFPEDVAGDTALATTSTDRTPFRFRVERLATKGESSVGYIGKILLPSLVVTNFAECIGAGSEYRIEEEDFRCATVIRSAERIEPRIKEISVRFGVHILDGQPHDTLVVGVNKLTDLSYALKGRVEMAS